RIEKIIKILNRRYKIKPWKEKPFKILISTILSQRTKDEITRKTSEQLLSKADTPEKILKLSEKEIEKLIYPVGFYRQKAKKIKRLCRILLKNYGGKVPDNREELLKLPGVGFKTADVVLSSHGLLVIAIDTHCKVIAKRLGLTKSDDAERIREDLHRIVPKKYRRIINLLFVEFGKEICQTRLPRCYICPIVSLCSYEPKTCRKLPLK
ncbi:MAG: endonuclease III, partial [Candidatus Aenigmarchaeota archaeon]|nr:endonuclease III [Candidatus Aenigmarchaeota archaeon]